MIYTSYHTKAVKLLEREIQPISISVIFPKYSSISYSQILDLAPTYSMLKLSENEYYKIFNARLDKLDPVQLFKLISSQKLKKGVALLCYEKDINQCHRKRVAEWLGEANNITIPEYDFQPLTMSLF